MWVPQKGTRASRNEAPILLVMPHSSFLDTALVTILHCPGLVVRDFTAKAPFFGDLIRYTQPLFVNSENPDSRRQISEAIRQRVRSEKNFEQLMLFPEGGCGNRKALLQFKLGAFSPGVSVQPVFVRYRNNLDTITWTWEGPGIWNRLWLSLAQFRIHCELEFLPVYKPSELEKKNPRLFANNVQHYVSSWTGCPLTHFSVEDACCLHVARKLHLPLTAPIIKFLRTRKAIGRQDIDPMEELNYLYERNRNLQHFEGSIAKLVEYLGTHRSSEALKDFFRIINQSDKDEIDVRIYAACLCLIRKDLSTSSKLKAAFQAFGSENRAEQLPTFLLIWKGIPIHFIKNLNTYDKNENEHDDKNFS